MCREPNLKAQEHLGELANAGAYDCVGEVFAEGAVDHDPAPDQGPGAESFRQVFTALGAAFPDDEHVAIACTLPGTHKGDFLGVPTTGRSIEVRGVRIARFADGMNVERWGSSAELGIMQQLGANVASRAARSVTCWRSPRRAQPGNGPAARVRRHVRRRDGARPRRRQRSDGSARPHRHPDLGRQAWPANRPAPRVRPAHRVSAHSFEPGR